jgi:hypothetical protein
MLKRTLLAIAAIILLAGTANLFAQNKPDADGAKAALRHQRGGQMPAEMQQRFAEFQKKMEERNIWVKDFTTAFEKNDKTVMTTMIEKMDKIVDADKKANEERMKAIEEHMKANEEKMKADPERMKAMEQRRKQMEERQAALAKADPNAPKAAIHAGQRPGQPGVRTGQFETWYVDLKTAFQGNDTAKMGQLLKDQNTRTAELQKRMQERMKNAPKFKGPQDPNAPKLDAKPAKEKNHADKPKNGKPKKDKK